MDLYHPTLGLNQKNKSNADINNFSILNCVFIYIKFNKGGKWHLISAPKYYLDGKLINTGLSTSGDLKSHQGWVL